MAHNAIKRKLTINDLFNCSDLSGFISSIIKVEPYKGVSMSRFYTCEYDGIRFLTKLGNYRKTPIELYGKVSKNVMPHIDAEINILKKLKERITDRNLSPCILELIYYKICEVSKLTPKEKQCEQLMFDYTDTNPEEDVEQLMCKYNDLVKNDLAHDKCAFLVLDRCDIHLDEFLRKIISSSVSITIFKSILFLIIYTIYVISIVYPGFKHYDLHTENIMLKFDSDFVFRADNIKYYVFHIDGQQYNIPYFGIIPKIIDFGFSALPEENIVSNATEDRVQMYYRPKNDLVFLFRHIYYTLSRSGADRLGRIDKLLQALEPNRTYAQYNVEYIRKIEDKIPTYENMIKNDIWSEYRKIKIQKNAIHAEFTPVSTSKN